MNPRVYRYAFRDDFPADYLPRASEALHRACLAWQASGAVSFIEDAHGDALDVLISCEPIGPRVVIEDNDYTRPLMEARRRRDGSGTKEIVVNSAYKWQVRAWQFWRLRWEPALFAHELWHVMANSSMHVPRVGSVAHFRPTCLPDEEDFALLRRHLEAHEFADTPRP